MLSKGPKIFKTRKKYRHIDVNGEDDAKDVRAKAERVFELISNEKLLQEERAKAEKLKGLKLTVGYGSDPSINAGGTTKDRYQPEPDRYSSFTPAETSGEAPKPRERDEEEEEEKEKPVDDDPFGPPPEMGGDGSKAKSKPTRAKSAQDISEIGQLNTRLSNFMVTWRRYTWI